MEFFLDRESPFRPEPSEFDKIREKLEEMMAQEPHVEAAFFSTINTLPPTDSILLIMKLSKVHRQKNDTTFNDTSHARNK
jgi:hypothetical protein